MKLTVDNYKPLYEADPAHWAEMSTDAKFDYLTDEIKKGNNDARFHLSLQVTKQNIKSVPADKIISWCHKMPFANLPIANLFLGFCYELGYGVQQDYVKALACYENANQKGSIDSLYYLGEMYRLGRGTKVNYQKAAAYLTDTVKYDTSNAKALVSLGLLYMEGNGVEENQDKALELMTEANILNDISSYYYMGILRERRGECSEAVKYYRNAHKFSDDAEEHAKAAYRLGVIYEEGQGIIHDDSKSFVYYLEAAQKGIVAAQYRVAVFFENGRGTDTDRRKARMWYLKAALGGNARAQRYVGELYEDGFKEENITPNIEAAFEWYMRAALQGDQEASEKAEYILSHGYNIHMNIGEALDWLRRSAANGNQGAVEELDRLKAENAIDEKSALQTNDTSHSAMADLDELIGMETIKKDVRELINLVKMQKLRKEKGMKSLPVSLHMVFTGNPGTGKTTVARIMADIYKEIGVLSKGQLVEVDRAGLVAGYVGQTAIKTQEKIDEANGGILFIDEAYTLAKKGNDYGQEAIDTLINLMEKRRDNFIVIVAGYPDLMKEFINSNPGLKSRFNKYIHFPDYSSEELVQIFSSLCDKYEYKLSDEAAKIIRQKIETHVANKNEQFSNARDIRNMFETIISNQASRVMTDENITDEELMTITETDIADK